MIIVIIITTEGTSNSALKVSFPSTRIEKIITIYPVIITEASLHLIADGDTTTLNMAGPIRMDTATDNIRDLMTGEIKSGNSAITTMKMKTATVMKIINRARVKEKAAAGILINDKVATTTIQKNK